MEGDSGNGRNRVDLSLTLGSPYPSQNVQPTQQSAGRGQMTNGGVASSAMNNGMVNANVNPVSYTSYMNRFHPLYNTLNNNIGGSLVVGVPPVAPGPNIDPPRRCSNTNCNTSDTPMWRKGPLGPQTLCNACGIKYGKAERSRAAEEAAASSTDNV